MHILYSDLRVCVFVCSTNICVHNFHFPLQCYTSLSKSQVFSKTIVVDFYTNLLAARVTSKTL